MSQELQLKQELLNLTSGRLLREKKKEKPPENIIWTLFTTPSILNYVFVILACNMLCLLGFYIVFYISSPLLAYM